MHPMLNIAIRAARRAGNIIIRNLDRVNDLEVTDKGHHDFVTEIDKEAEAAIIDVLLTAYPTHQIIAEESGEHGDSEYVWIIDPLDGTANFLHTFPQFAVSIALQVNGRLDQGVIYDPNRDELFTASRGQGALLNNRRIRASRREKLSNALIATGFPVREPAQLEPYLKTFNALLPLVADIRRAGAASLDLAYVACGRLDGYWENGLKSWDLAAGALIVQEAGGIVSDPSGGDNYLSQGNIVAAPSRLFKPLLVQLAKLQTKVV